MENESIAPVRDKISLDFKQLPGFAKFILHQRLDSFAQALIRLYLENDIPLLRFFSSMGDDQRLALVTASAREMLTLLATNNACQYIDQSVQNWLNNQIPMITREQVQAQDITLVNHVRGKVFRSFIPLYTDDRQVSFDLVEEIEQYIVVLDSELFSAYMGLQEQQIKNINTALQKREQQLLEAQEIGQVGSFEWDLLGTKQSSFTPQMFKIFEMEGPSNVMAFLDHVHPEEREKVRRAIEKALVDGDYECEYRYIKNNKEKIIYSRGKVQFKDDKPARMLGTVTDVTEHHHMLQRLRESEQLHKQAQALTHIGNWSWVIHDKKITWSDEMYRIYGLAPQSEEITFERFLSFIHPEDKEVRLAEIQHSLETLTVKEYHFRITTAEGLQKVLRGKGEMVADQNGRPLVMLGTCQDVTREFTLTRELREREQYLEKLNQSLEHANQELSRSNEELESFNFIASHDLQEPLRKIQVYSNRILESGLNELPESLREYFSRINKASNRMQKLIEDFLSFSQTFNISHAAEEVDMNKMMEEIRMELTTRIEEKRAELTTTVLPPVYGIPFQIKQLMINLISNALKYTDPGVAPQIAITGSIEIGSNVPEEDAGPKISYTKISVADKGIGFEEKYKTKIFELFQRLHSKNAYSGTGIGLALCKKIVQNMQGFITAESQPGKGSVFTFYLPVKPVDD